MGYAALVLLQHRLSQAMDLETDSVFQHGCSFNYIGNLIFRLAHNVVFSKIRPRHRVKHSIKNSFTRWCSIMTIEWCGFRWIIGDLPPGISILNVVARAIVGSCSLTTIHLDGKCN